MNWQGLVKSLICCVLTLFLISCSIERKIAQTFVRDKKEKSVLVFFPAEIIKTNLKIQQYKTADSLDQHRLDSASPAKSIFLRQINDSLFLLHFKNEFIKELHAFGYHVYELEDIDDFIALKDSSYVLNLAQLEIEEYIYVGYKDEFVYYVNDTSAKIYLNAVNLNSWFELNRNQFPNEVYPVLYSSYYILDKITDMSTYARTSKYKQDTIKMEDIYKLAELAGKYNAVNFYDYILNLHIQDQIPEGRIPNYYFHYNRRGRSIQTFYNDAFIEIDP